MKIPFLIKAFIICLVVISMFAACVYKDEEKEVNQPEPPAEQKERADVAVISPYQLKDRELHLLRGAGVDTNDFLAFVVDWNGQEPKPLKARIDVYENGQFKQAIFEDAVLTTDDPDQEHLLTFAKHDNSNSARETEWIVSYQPGSSFTSNYNTSREMTGWSLQKVERDYEIQSGKKYVLGALLGGRSGNVQSDFSLTEEGELSPETLKNDFVYVFSVEVTE
ncbi:hypothetical protein ACFOU2_17480 [Bacillus songklensis]|uniref:Lipoprotein n=1 Tax=Bacillus songklensis TaxID=1069116 RepID=A0ABV8B4F7_9BACI